MCASLPLNPLPAPGLLSQLFASGSAVPDTWCGPRPHKTRPLVQAPCPLYCSFADCPGRSPRLLMAEDYSGYKPGPFCRAMSQPCSDCPQPRDLAQAHHPWAALVSVQHRGPGRPKRKPLLDTPSSLPSASERTPNTVCPTPVGRVGVTAPSQNPCLSPW